MIRRFIEWVKALVNIARTREDLGFYKNGMDFQFSRLKSWCDEEEKRVRHMIWQAKQRGRLK